MSAGSTSSRDSFDGWQIQQNSIVVAEAHRGFDCIASVDRESSVTLKFMMAFALAVLSSPAFAQEPDSPSMNAEQAVKAESVEKLGREIYELDLAAAVATDQISDIGLRSDKRVKGWITEPTVSGIKVTMVGFNDEAVPLALYVSEVDRSGKPIGAPTANSDPVPLSDAQSALYSARSNALNSKYEPCSKSYNTVAVPTSSGISVYLLPGTTDPDVVPIGGSYRIDYDATGKVQLATRAYTKSCISLQKDKKSVGMMITHLMDDFPTEVHAYWSLWAKSPMYVGIVTTKDLWSITDGKLKLVVRGK